MGKFPEQTPFGTTNSRQYDQWYRWQQMFQDKFTLVEVDSVVR